MNNTRKVHRVNVNFTEEAWDVLQDLAERRGKTVSQVLRDAIALERWFDATYERGERVLLQEIGSDTVREVVLR